MMRGKDNWVLPVFGNWRVPKPATDAQDAIDKDRIQVFQLRTWFDVSVCTECSDVFLERFGLRYPDESVGSLMKFRRFDESCDPILLVGAFAVADESSKKCY